MDTDQAEQLAEGLADEFGIDVEVRPDYSGRGMYGATVPAFVTDEDADKVLAALGFVAGKRGIPFDDLPTRTDSMGLGVVIY
jgi:hypothetical protein